MQAAALASQDAMRSPNTRENTAAPAKHGNAYPGTTHVPPAFDRMARSDFALLSEAHDTLEWEDYSPAYAMSLMTYASCYRDVTHVSETELRAQWDDLRGMSRLSWLQAQTVIARSWKALAELDRHGLV